MPLKPIEPSPQRRTPYYYVRGTYLGCRINRSLKTGEKTLATKLIRQIERDIERGAITPGRALGFAEAASAYMKAGGERSFLAPIIAHLKHTPLSQIDQTMIDHTAAALYPNATAATLNRQVYTPISAVLKRAGEERKIKRPKGWEGRKLTHWLSQQQAFAIFRAALKIRAPADMRAQFRAFLILLCYTGMRLSDARGLERANIKPVYNRRRKAWTGTALLPETKNGRPRLAYLPQVVVTELRKMPGGIDGGGKLFAFHRGGKYRPHDLLRATLEAAGVVLPRRVAFHVFCHTWATWMRQHGGLDTYDLVRTDRWAEAGSADRYAHVVVSEVAQRAEMLPVEGRRKTG